jgi:hypothetical protein
MRHLQFSKQSNNGSEIEMSKFAINIMGYWEDATGKYTQDQVEEMFEVIGYKFEPMKVVGVSVKTLPADHIVIERKEVKKRTGILGKALDYQKELKSKK